MSSNLVGSLELQEVFRVPLMYRVWRTRVRNDMRRQPILDLHDYLDIHRNIRPLLRRLRRSILEGVFRPSEPEIVTLEKRFGVSRRIVVPDPLDAIVLQTITTVLEPRLKKAAPTKKAFYSQSNLPKQPEDFEGVFGYPWWLLWPKFQQEIHGFTRSHDFILITDLANYYDSISFAVLRDKIGSMSNARQSFLDFLFFVLESLVWRPDYIPHPGAGLPQINLDAPRLLAHVFLYPIDNALQDLASSGDFVRWMDDIDVAVDNIPHAKNILAKIEPLLAKQGVRINSGKTKILSSREAHKHFFVDENIALNLCSNALDNNPSSKIKKRVLSIAKRRFIQHQSDDPAGQWEKVFKRYFTLFTKLRSAFLMPFCPASLRDYPGARASVLRYYKTLGHSLGRSKVLQQYLLSSDAIDDASIFACVDVLVSWETPKSEPIRSRMTQLGDSIARSEPKSTTRFVAGLWLVAKYGTSGQLNRFLMSTESTWTRSEFSARQAAAAMARLSKPSRARVRDLLSRSGATSALQVLESVQAIASKPQLDAQARAYLMQRPAQGYTYPLSKALLAVAVRSGEMARSDRVEFCREIRSLSADPYYLSWLTAPRK